MMRLFDATIMFAPPDDAGAGGDTGGNDGVPDGGGNAGIGAGAGPGPGSEGSWYGTFSEDNRAIVEKNGWADKSPETVVSSYGELHSLLGNRDMEGYVKIPDGDDSWDDAYNALGRPESANLYQAPEFPENYPVENDPTAEWFKERAYERGLSSKQYTDVMNDYYGWQGELHAEEDANYEQALNEFDQRLRAEKGTMYAEHIALGNKAAGAWGLDEAQIAAITAAVGPEVSTAMFTSHGQAISSDSGPVSGTSADMRSGGQNTTWAQGEIDTLQSDQEFMEAIANNRLDDPKFTSKLERWNRANAIRHGAAPPT